MADLSKLSDAELERIANSSKPKLEDMTDEELESIAGGNSQSKKTLDRLPTKGFLDTALEDYLVPAGRAVDSYTGAPTRAAIGALQDSKDPFKAAAMQVGVEPELAPTGKEIVKKQFPNFSDKSVSDVFPNLYSETGDGLLKFKRGGLLDPTALGAAGFVVDIVADPTNILPLGAIAKGLGKGAAGLLKIAGEGAVKGTGLAARGSALVADLITDTKLGTNALKVADKGVDVGKKAIQRTTDLITNIAKPKRVENFAKLEATAKSLGIDPEDLTLAAEFGKTSTPSFLERSLREGPTGDPLMKKFDSVQNSLSEAVETKLINVGGGSVPDVIQVGDTIKSGFEAAQKNILSQNDLTYKTAAKLSPNLQLTPDAMAALQSKLNGIEKTAKGLATRGVSKEQVSAGKELLNSVQRMRGNRSNYKQLSEQIAYIGDAMTSPGTPRAMAKELRDLYSTVSESLIGTVKDLDPKLGQQLVDNNKNLSEFFKSRDLIGNLKDVAPERVFRTILGDSRKIDELKKILQPEEFSQLKSSFLDSIVKRNADGDVLWGSTTKALDRSKATVSKLFSPEELTDLADILELGLAQGEAVLSSSRTGASAKFTDVIKKVPGLLMDEEILSGIKASGRASIKEPKIIKNPTRGSVNADLFTDALKLRRSRPERILKGVQSIAPSQYREKE